MHACLVMAYVALERSKTRVSMEIEIDTGMAGVKAVHIRGEYRECFFIILNMNIIYVFI